MQKCVRSRSTTKQARSSRVCIRSFTARPVDKKAEHAWANGPSQTSLTTIRWSKRAHGPLNASPTFPAAHPATPLTRAHHRTIRISKLRRRPTRHEFSSPTAGRPPLFSRPAPRDSNGAAGGRAPRSTPPAPRRPRTASPRSSSGPRSLTGAPANRRGPHAGVIAGPAGTLRPAGSRLFIRSLFRPRRNTETEILRPRSRRFHLASPVSSRPAVVESERAAGFSSAMATSGDQSAGGGTWGSCFFLKKNCAWFLWILRRNACASMRGDFVSYSV